MEKLSPPQSRMRDGLKNEGPATPDPARGARPAGGGHAAARLVGAIWQPRGHPHGRRPPFRWPFRPPRGPSATKPAHLLRLDGIPRPRRYE